VGIGDSAATLFGKMFGKWHWKNSKKTVEGTVGAISLVLICWYILLFLVQFLGLIEIVSLSWTSIFWSTICVCLVEAWTDQIDNLYLPLFYYYVLHLCARVVD
jgi:dolichol kinase